MPKDDLSTLIKNISKTSISSGGASFATHSLKQVAANQLVFKATLTSYLFCYIIMLIGLTCGVAFLIAGFQTGQFPAFIASALGFLFIWIGRYVQKNHMSERTIDLIKQTVEIPSKSREANRTLQIIAFNDIAALQIVEKEVIGSDFDYNGSVSE